MNIRIAAMKASEAGELTYDEEKLEFDRAFALEGGRDPYLIGWEIVQAILKLNELHSLEKIRI